MPVVHVLVGLLMTEAAHAQALNPTPPESAAPYQVVERGYHHRVCEQAVVRTNADGASTVIVRTNRWVELGTGMHVRGSDGQWTEAGTEIEPAPGGALARKGQTRVFFAANLNTAGAIDITASDGKRFRCTIVGLAYFDTASRQRQLLSPIKDSFGQILSSGNQVLYPDAFTNGIKASVLYNYTKAGLQQCVVLDGQPPVTPADVGLNPQTTLLEAITEFIEAPTPVVTNVLLGAVGPASSPTPAVARHLGALTRSPAPAQNALAPLSDDRLDFGALKMTPGKAFSVAGSQRGSGALPVGKSWQHVQQRTFLFERVRYRQAEQYLTNLPPARAELRSKRHWVAAGAPLPSGAKTRPEETTSLPAPQRLAPQTTNTMLVASVSIPGHDFVIDFDLGTGYGDYTLRGDTQYRVVAPVDIYGTLTVEGGTSVSYPIVEQAVIDTLGEPVINVWGELVCNTRPYAPAVFASDRRGMALYGAGTGQLHDLRFTGFDHAIIGGSSARDLQFINCGSAFSGGLWYYVGNCLFVGVSHCFDSWCEDDAYNNCGYPGLTIVAENVTFDGCGELVYDPTSFIRLVNCLMGVNITDPYFTPQLINSQPCNGFQSAGGGNHYLPADSPARGQGDPSAIDPGLLSELRTKTTQPPLAHVGENIANGTDFAPQVQLDSGDSLDLGYHYDPLDYVFVGCNGSGNITFSAGTRAGWLRTLPDSDWVNVPGIALGENTTVTFDGSPTAPACWFRANTVQEGDPSTGTGPAGITGASQTAAVHARFTRCFAMADEPTSYFGGGAGVCSPFVVCAQDCEFSNGRLTDDAALSLTNCLFDGCAIAKLCDCWGDFNLINCTLRGGSPSGPSLWLHHEGYGSSLCHTLVRNCAFDETSIVLGPAQSGSQPDWPGSFFDFDYNAFSGADPTYAPSGPPSRPANDLAPVDFDWQAGALGNFYLPAGSPLVDKGCTTADQVGLYHYTTQVSPGTVEGSSPVDIGYHYLGVYDNGSPLDYDRDGLPNYLEDANGNGVFDSGETDWQTANRDSDPCAFSVTFDSLRTSSATLTATLTILQGLPYQVVVQMDNNTNFDNPQWTAYSPTLSIPFAVSEGQHQVWIGLKGQSSLPMWQGFTITRDLTPPRVYLTSPTSTSLTQPLLQLSGYACEPVSVRWTAAPAGAGEDGYITNQWFDTNLFQFTTNWFSCLDIPLTNGANTITLYVTDRAGLTTTNVYTFNFSYPTTPPSLSLYWPQEGTRVSGTFTLRGWVSDATATVVAQVTAPDGSTNAAVQAIVERNGLVWAENLSLADGVNTVTLTATDVGGNSTSNKFNVIKSDVNLVIDPLDGTALTQPTVTVTGTIDATGYTIWVNGKAVDSDDVWPNGDGTYGWQANNVPLPIGGTGLIQARAIPSSETGLSGSQAVTYQNPGNPSSAQAVTAEYQHDEDPVVVSVLYYMARSDGLICDPTGAFDKVTERVDWTADHPGSAAWDECRGFPSMTYYYWTEKDWDECGDGFLVSNYGLTSESVCGLKADGESEPIHVFPAAGTEYCRVNATRSSVMRGGAYVQVEDRSRSACVRYVLHTGGKAKSSARNLFVGTVTAKDILDPFYPEVDKDGSPSIPIQSTSIKLGELGSLGNDGRVYKLLADNQTVDFTPWAVGHTYYVFEALDVTKCKLSIVADAGVKAATLDPEKVVTDAQFIVGYKFTFSTVWDQTPPNIQSATNQWDFSGHWFNAGTNASTNVNCSKIYFQDSQDLKNGDVTNMWWVSGGFNPPEQEHATVDLGLTFSNGQHVVVPAKGRFNMFKPDGKITARTTSVSVGNDPDLGWVLFFGDPNSTPGHGIIFYNTFRLATNSSGEAFAGGRKWIQVDYDPKATRLESNGTNHKEVMNGPDPYGDYAPDGAIAWPDNKFLKDAPDVPFDDPNLSLPPPNYNYSCGEASDRLTMWMMFQPVGGVMVPLRAVAWEWHGVATNGSSAWGLQSKPTDHTVNPQDYPTEDYPIWKSSARDCHWEP